MPNLTRSKKIKIASSERIENKKLELKQLILETASQLFLEKGYEKFSLRQVAERIGYSATTIYLYFKDKDDLLFSIVLEGFEIFYKMMKDASDSMNNTLDKLHEVGRAYINFGLSYPLYYQMMFMQRTDFLMKSKPGEDEPMITSFKILSNLVQKAIDEKLLKYSENCHQIYTSLLWANTHGTISLHIVMPDVYTRKNVDMMLESGLRLSIQGLSIK